jgi:hypothetical protein
MTASTKGKALAPAQHLRSTLGILLLGATLALSACGTQQAGAAAIVDGQTISDKDVQNATLQLNRLAQTPEEKLKPSTVLLNLIIARYVLPEAERAGKGATDAQARQAVAKLPSPSRQTLDFVRMQLVIQTLTPASQASVLAQLGKAKVTVNPRYGTFDAKRVGIATPTPNWIKAAAASGAK